MAITTIEDAKKLIIQKFPHKIASRAFSVLVEEMLEGVGQMVWREFKWSFSKTRKAPPDGSYISFVAGTYEYDVPNDFNYPVYMWCKEKPHPNKIDILSEEQFAERHSDYTLVIGYPSVTVFGSSMWIYGDTSADVGLIYQHTGGASDLLSQGTEFLFILIEGVVSAVHDAGSQQEQDAFQRFWQRLDARAKMDASHFEPTILMKPDPFYQKLQRVRRGLR